MNRAIATASGAAISNASAADSSVPNSRGQMYTVTPAPPGTSSAGATTAGHASTTKNAATPARIAKISTPEPVDSPAKIRSPVRTRARGRTDCSSADTNQSFPSDGGGEMTGGRTADRRPGGPGGNRSGNRRLAGSANLGSSSTEPPGNRDTDGRPGIDRRVAGES